MMTKALADIASGHKALSLFVKDNAPSNPIPSQSDNVYDPGFGKSRQPGLYHYAQTRAGAQPARPRATPQGAGTPDAKAAATTQDTPNDDDIMRFRALMAEMRQGVKESAPLQ